MDAQEVFQGNNRAGFVSISFCISKKCQLLGSNFQSAKGEGSLFTETLSKETKAALDLLSDCLLMSNAYLAGGTSCALQLGHRISVALDFFTPKEFDAKMLIRSLHKNSDGGNII